MKKNLFNYWIQIFLCMLIHELQFHHLPWLNVKILIMLPNVKILIILCIFCLKFIIKLSGFILDWDKPWNLLTYTSQPTQENSAELAQISRIIYWNNLLNTLSHFFSFVRIKLTSLTKHCPSEVWGTLFCKQFSLTDFEIWGQVLSSTFGNKKIKKKTSVS